MLLKGNDLLERNVQKTLGSSMDIGLKKLKGIGSASYFLKGLVGFDSKIFNQIENARCNFQVYQKGLLLRLNSSNQLFAIPILFEELKDFRLVKGDEKVSPFPLSPFWILLKFGVKLSIAKHFSIYLLKEYFINEMKICVRTEKFELVLESNGYKFYEQIKFFGDAVPKGKFIIDGN